LRREQGALHVVEPTDAEALRAVMGVLARQKFSRGSPNRG
jgi:hypothetical protein